MEYSQESFISTLHNTQVDSSSIINQTFQQSSQNIAHLFNSQTPEMNAIKQILMQYDRKFSQMQQHIQSLEQQILQLKNPSTKEPSKNNFVQKPQKQAQIWTQEEKEQFIEALCLTHKSNIKVINQFIQTKSARQIISHSQKLFTKLNNIAINEISKSYITPQPQDIQNFCKFIAMINCQQFLTILKFLLDYKSKNVQQDREMVEQSKKNCTCSGSCKICILRQLFNIAKNFEYLSHFTKYESAQIINFFLKVYQISQKNITFAIKFTAERLGLAEGLLYIIIQDIMEANDPDHKIGIAYLQTCLKHQYIHPRDEAFYATHSLASMHETPNVGSETDMNQLVSFDLMESY